MEFFQLRCSDESGSSRIFHGKDCAARARVIITIALRVRVFRMGVWQLSEAASARRLLMPARETEAIILKTFPLGEADRLVSFLGRSSGRVRGVASGARRLKNRYGSTLEVLSHVQIWYVEKETRELVRIQQAELLESFHKAQSNYGLSTGLAVISEIAELILPEHEVSEAMFRLILLATREVERTGDWALPLSYFAFWTVRLGGWLPRFDRCAACGTPFGTKPAFYDAHQSGLFCEICRRAGMKPLHHEARILAERFASERLDRIDYQMSLQASARELREASLGWIENHLEKRLKTRELLETT
jgi:DNA repair protein RecO (recombination protein O)